MVRIFLFFPIYLVVGYVIGLAIDYLTTPTFELSHGIISKFGIFGCFVFVIFWLVAIFEPRKKNK